MKERALDVLLNDAWIQLLPLMGGTDREYEIKMGSNCLAHYILTQELLHTMRSNSTARREDKRPAGSVRVLSVGSILIDTESSKDGIDFNESGAPKIQLTTWMNYAHSKAGNLMLAK